VGSCSVRPAGLLTCTSVSHFPTIPRRMSSTRLANQRSTPFVQHSRLSRRARPHQIAGMRRSGRAGRAGRRLLKRREWRSLIERCCFHRSCRSTQRRTSCGLVRLCRGRRTRTAARLAGGSSLVPCLRGRRGDRVHCRLFRRRVPSSGQRPAGRGSASALRGTGSDLPRPGLATASAHRLLKLKRL
jgi:hypothetical protein